MENENEGEQSHLVNAQWDALGMSLVLKINLKDTNDLLHTLLPTVFDLSFPLQVSGCVSDLIAHATFT